MEVTFSSETLDIFDELLGQVTISAADPNFDELVARVSRARQELAAARSAP